MLRMLSPTSVLHCHFEGRIIRLYVKQKVTTLLESVEDKQRLYLTIIHQEVSQAGETLSVQPDVLWNYFSYFRSH